MILLLGGTSETAMIATRLAASGHRVLISTATDEPLDVGGDARIERRCGRLDEAGMVSLVKHRGVTAVVDATHPYAAVVHGTASRVAKQTGVPHFRFQRPDSVLGASVVEAADHAAAARVACSFGKPVLLTTGSNNLRPYVEAARRVGVRLVARVLPRPESLLACREAGIADANVIAGKGPFTVEETRDHIRRFAVGVLVSKESGEAGGVPAKIEAARLERCKVVVVRRPGSSARSGCSDVAELVETVVLELRAARGSKTVVPLTPRVP